MIAALTLLFGAGTAAAAGLPPIVESQPLGAGSAAAPRQPAATQQPAPPPQRPRTLEERVDRLEHMVESQALVDMLMRLNTLQQDVETLRGQSEVQTHELDGIKQRQRELYVDIDRRIHDLELRQASAPAAPAVPGPSAPAAPSVPVPPLPAPASGAVQGPAAPAAGTTPPADGAVTGQQDPIAEQTAYEKAFDTLKAGRYQESISAFRNFLSRYPSGDYAANAQYWIGEANYVMNRFPAAVDEFEKVVKVYPDGNKTPDALLKLGYSYYEMQQWDRARSALDKLVKQYPDSTAAQLAQNRLHRMAVEGR